MIGDCIECPFHQWRFDGETGKCVKGPSSEKVSHETDSSLKAIKFTVISSKSIFSIALLIF